MAAAYPFGQGDALLEDDSTSDPLSLGVACLLRGMYEGEGARQPVSGEGAEDHQETAWREMVDREVHWVKKIVRKV